MNIITPTSYEFLCQHINGSTFAADLTNFTSYYQINSIETSKLIEVVEVSTITEASINEQIRAVTSGATVKMTHPFNTWNNEGFVVGDTVRVEANGTFTTGTVASIVGVDIYLTAATFFADLSTTDGDERDDYVVKSTTVPTSLIYDYGINPNSQDEPTFTSPLTGNPLTYAGDGITGALTDINFRGLARDNMGTVQCKYDGASGTGNYIFTFTIEHVFQNPFYIASWLKNYQNGTVPESYKGHNSYKYVSRMNFGTNINNTNDGKIFVDSFQDGSTGLHNQNFNAGGVNYTLNSIAYADGATTIDRINADVSTDVTIQIKNEVGVFAAGARAYVYHTKLASDSEYTTEERSEVETDFDTMFVFKSHTNVDGGIKSTNGFIVNLLVVVNAVDASLLDVTFTLTYTSSELERIIQNDPYFLGVGVQDGTKTSTMSDRVIVWADEAEYDKSEDITGLITANQMNFFNSIEDPALATPTSNANTWNQTIHKLTGSFRATKTLGNIEGSLFELKLREVSYYAAESKHFTIQEFTFPLGSPPNVIVDETAYQAVNVDTTRPLGNIKDGDQLHEVKLSSTIPGAFQNYQLFDWQLGWVFAWREWVANQDVESVAPEFYDSSEDNNNYNTRTSNYSALLNYDIYLFLTATIRKNDTLTVYNLMSDKCTIKDFDVDLVGTGWVQQSYKIYDENGIETNDLFSGQDMTLIVIIDNPGALLTLNNTGGEIVAEVSGSNGEHSRLHSSIDWESDGNLLKPIVGSDYVDMTQVAGAPNEVHLTCLIKGDKLDPANDYNFYAHLNSL